MKSSMQIEHPVPDVRDRAALPGALGAVWGLAGVFSLLSFAIVRLSAVARQAFEQPLGALGWTVLIGFTGFMLYSEGFRGFQRGFAPRVAARARCVARCPTLPRVLFAPLFCMGYFDATRRRLISTYALTAMIVTFVTLFQFIPQPWRGILDVGVAAGLIWGVACIAVYSFRAFFSSGFDRSPETAHPCP